MAAQSNRSLWQFISGSSLLRPAELIGDEIKRNKEKLQQGLLHYQKPRTPAGEKLKSERKVKGTQLEFVQKLSKFLGLDEVQSHDLFYSYLLHDYRGSQKELKSVLSVERHAQGLILKVRDYYYSERLYLLRCLKYMFSYWQEESHPYREKYAEFIETACEDDKFIKDILQQYEDLCDEPAPTWEKHGNLMNDRQGSIWLMQAIKEQCELLNIMLLFYKDFEHSPQSLLKLVTRFKKQGFGRRQTNKHLLDEVMEPLIHRLGCLQVLITIEGLDLEFMYRCNEANSTSEHHILKSKEFKEIDNIMCSMTDNVQHGPLALMWAVVRHIALGQQGQAMTRKLGNAGLSLHVFKYLASILETEPFNGKTTTASVAQYVLYGLLCLVLSIFHEETLGDTESLYIVAEKLLQRGFICEDFWNKGLGEGLGNLLQSCLNRFPLDFKSLINLSAALASSSKTGARKVVKLVQDLPMYTEYLDRNSSHDLQSTQEEMIWRLARDKVPYQNRSFIIPRGTMGQLIQPEKTSPIIQWEYSYNGWLMFQCEVESFLHQISHGAGTVTRENIENITDIARLLSAVMSSDPSTTPMFTEIAQRFILVIQRFCVISPPQLELLANSLEVVICLAKHSPIQTWHSVQQIGLVPTLTENYADVKEATSGVGLNSGAYGTLLAGCECTCGRYPLTLAFLQLVSNLVQPLHEKGRLNELMASMLFITREIFPVFHKWRYYDFSRREQVGQRSLEVFHKVLNILSPEKSKPSQGPSLREVCVYALLFTESGKALLDIISTGVDNVETALAQQGSSVEGAGIEMIQLIRMAFSVLNRLLMLRPADLPPSPVEHSLSAQPANRSNRHVVATIAQYIYHRHDPRLPVLATLLLKRLAMVFPMSILSCLGQEAEAIRDIYLARLQAKTEDIRLKVVILELLAICVETQPGLIEMFLNVQPSTTDKGKKDLAIGRSSCLQTVLDLMEEKKQGSHHCPSDLLCACMELVHSLWYGRRETAMAVLREKDIFWRSVCLSLMKDLPHADEENIDVEVLEREVKTCASILKILSQELYHVDGAKIDNNLNKVLKEIVGEKRLLYWSTYLSESMQKCSGYDDQEISDGTTERGVLQLLLAWKNLTLILANSKIDAVPLAADMKSRIMQDLLDGLQSQFSNSMTALHIKLASVSSAQYFTLLKSWKRSVKDWNAVASQLEETLNQTCANSETLIPSVQIGILGSLAVGLQHVRIDSTKDISQQTVKQIVPVVCSVLQQSTYQLPVPKRKRTNAMEEDENKESDADVKLKLQIITVSLTEEIILSLPNVEMWLPALKEHSIVPCLIDSVKMWLEAQQGIQYVQAVLLLFLTLSKIPASAEALALNGLNQHLCLALGSLYNNEISHPVTVQQQTPSKSSKQENGKEQLTWTGIYRLYTTTVSTLLATLRYNFLKDSLDFVGVHQDRMLISLESVRVNLKTACLLEAEHTARFLNQLSHFRKEWRLHLPDVLNKLMTSLCYLSQTCVSLLIRPRLLNHMLQKQGGKQVPQDKLTMTPITQLSRLSSQSSLTDEGDSSSQEVLDTQHRLLEILSQCLAALRQFSPDLCEILLDQSMDVAEYDPMLMIGFSTPAVDQDNPPTFGAMVSCISLCIRLLSKIDPKNTSPVKSPVPSGMPIRRSLVMFVLENALYLIMSQAMRYLREPAMSSREKQLLKRELSAELNSFLMSMQRYLRRGGPTSPANQSLMSPQGSLANKSSQIIFASSQENDFLRLVDSFVRNVLR